MTKRKVFFSFEHDKDCARATQIRKMDKFHEESVFPDEEWKEVVKKTDDEVKSWIDERLKNCECLLVLIGHTTHEDKWVNYEIKKAYDLKKGIFGVYIHGFKDADGNQCEKGKNLFKDIHNGNNVALSDFIPCYDTDYLTAPYIAEYFEQHMESFIAHAMNNIKNY